MGLGCVEVGGDPGEQLRFALVVNDPVGQRREARQGEGLPEQIGDLSRGDPGRLAGWAGRSS